MSGFGMLVVANHTSFLLLGCMIQIKYWHCTEEKRLSGHPPGGCKVMRIRETGSGSGGGNISSSEGTCELVIQKITVILGP